MPRIRQLLLLTAAGIGIAAAVLSAPIAAADDQPGQPNQPNQANSAPLPNCETYDGSSVVGGQTTMCSTPGNVQLNSTPQQYPGEEPFYGFPAFGFW
ncbi:hypothetical protein [Mycolicibacterium sphagni]|jgi:hypothetical protein|uniref:DUF3761 domain-containing protein n=1 Tax=Mycolicibacterium sphagni TaxID=1786 RepID=A0A255DKJ2_9MYCO|nr:hypothetical protein [Mycolicibacterium sphagni]MCV7178455.1 hypothetical protein [Mycolicibacterium sphagni]OYN79918.1 hypothetical protein CG716_10680 [Mycolicibacterium sphagni]